MPTEKDFVLSRYPSADMRRVILERLGALGGPMECTVYSEPILGARKLGAGPSEAAAWLAAAVKIRAEESQKPA